jgi:hypothetical protein
MVIAWQLKDEKGELITTCFKERDAIRARDKLEEKGQVVRIDKVFDHHLKDRVPVKKKTRVEKPKLKSDVEIIPAKCHPVMFFVRDGDLITSELGLAAKHHGKVVDGITRLIVVKSKTIVPVIVKEIPDDNK